MCYFFQRQWESEPGKHERDALVVLRSSFDVVVVHRPSQYRCVVHRFHEWKRLLVCVTSKTIDDGVAHYQRFFFMCMVCVFSLRLSAACIICVYYGSPTCYFGGCLSRHYKQACGVLSSCRSVASLFTSIAGRRCAAWAMRSTDFCTSMWRGQKQSRRPLHLHQSLMRSYRLCIEFDCSGAFFTGILENQRDSSSLLCFGTFFFFQSGEYAPTSQGSIMPP